MADKEKDQREDLEKGDGSEISDVSEREKLVAKKLQAAVKKRRASSAQQDDVDDEVEETVIASSNTIEEHDDTPLPSDLRKSQQAKAVASEDLDDEDLEDDDYEDEDEDGELTAAAAEAEAESMAAAAAAAAAKAEEAKRAAEEAARLAKEAEEAKKQSAKAKKKKKKSKASSDKDVAEKETAKQDREDQEEPVSLEPREGDIIGGVFTPTKAYVEPDNYNDDPEGVDPTETPLGVWFGAAAVVLILSAVAVFLYADKTEDIKDVLAGTYKAKKIAERERREEEHRLAELKKLNKFGNLAISGYPQYADLTFNGKPRYGMTSTGEWRAVSLIGTVPFKNLNIKDELEITISAPGFQPVTEKVTEGTWQKNSSGDDYSKIIGANLAPVSEAHKREFDQRLAPDVDHEFFGTITITSTPPGATVNIDGHPLKDAEGKDLKTPVTFDKNYVLNEETKKYEEVLMKVDTVLDVGHKILVSYDFPNQCAEGQTECKNDDGCCPAGPKCNVATDTDCKYPTLVTALQRQNWTCTFDEEKLKAAMEALSEGKAESPAVIQQACAYSYKLNADLEGIKTYAREQEAERQRIMKLNAELEAAEGGEGSEGEGEEAAK